MRYKGMERYKISVGNIYVISFRLTVAREIYGYQATTLYIVKDDTYTHCMLQTCNHITPVQTYIAFIAIMNPGCKLSVFYKALISYQSDAIVAKSSENNNNVTNQNSFHQIKA